MLNTLSNSSFPSPFHSSGRHGLVPRDISVNAFQGLSLCIYISRSDTFMQIHSLMHICNINDIICIHMGDPIYDASTYDSVTLWWCKFGVCLVETLHRFFTLFLANDMWCSTLLWSPASMTISSSPGRKDRKYRLWAKILALVRCLE